MAHFAKLNEDNIVETVIVVDNNDCLDSNGQESEEIGISFCESLVPGRWVQTSYNNNFRKNYAGIGYEYDEERDAFIAPMPVVEDVVFEFDEDTCRWVVVEDNRNRDVP
jgi:hypothetical protein